MEGVGLRVKPQTLNYNLLLAHEFSGLAHAFSGLAHELSGFLPTKLEAHKFLWARPKSLPKAMVFK